MPISGGLIFGTLGMNPPVGSEAPSKREPYAHRTRFCYPVRINFCRSWPNGLRDGRWRLSRLEAPGAIFRPNTAAGLLVSFAREWGPDLPSHRAGS
jgi:hypothetical protein